MRGSADTQRVARLAARQRGNVTVAQMRHAGLEDAEIERRVACGWLIRRHRSVYAVGHVPRSRESRWHAATLALGPAAALSVRAAGAWWGIVRGAVPTEVTVPTPAGHMRRDGIIIHRAPLPEGHVDVRDGLRVTSLIRTVLDLAAVLSLRELGRAFEQAQVLHELSPVPLGVEVMVRRGYRGNARMRCVLRGAVDPAAVRSVLELRFLQLCDRYGIPRPLVNEKIGIWTPDFLWPDRSLVVETDGHAFHRTAAARRRDALKDAELRALGLTVIRVTWQDVHERPAAVADAVSVS